MEIGKAAGVNCEFQRFLKGCSVYDKRPHSCRAWSCQWLVESKGLKRPDICHYVVDIVPDYITVKKGKEADQLPCVQVWLDPKHPNAYRDENLLNFLSLEGKAGLIRLNSEEAFMLFPPSIAGEWTEVRGCEMETRERANEN